MNPLHIPKTAQHTGVRERVFQAILELKLTGEEPLKIYLTAADEAELAQAGVEVHGKVMWEKIQQVGLRAALKRYMGLKVYWDAEQTAVKG